MMRTSVIINSLQDLNGYEVAQIKRKKSTSPITNYAVTSQVKRGLCLHSLHYTSCKTLLEF